MGLLLMYAMNEGIHTSDNKQRHSVLVLVNGCNIFCDSVIVQNCSHAP